ncbi:neuronal pentraxin receptor [Nematolebias whitei]|uniref:neuronal pentraxin receptor n=1 Tax=Nematolebias whitei TaxID=451745 RepID=UPI001896D6E0|nr:neuronal pentraxin receptor [Nematolebias whitei]
MVAFIGAVICIIAAVHTGSSRGAAAAQRQPAADNHSLFPDAAAQTPAAGGSVARAGALGALHGSETPDSEAPTFRAGLDGVTGLTGHDPTVSRLICTPIPAGECSTRNFQQQAEDPALYAGEDWGYLRTAAEELRHTVRQQKEQISSERRTIRELAGKLSECEKGLGGRGRGGRGGGSSSAERRGHPAGLRGAPEETHLERMMVRDSPASEPDGGHLLTAGAVEQLEQAISQLQDRIEKLEVAQLPLNLSQGSWQHICVSWTQRGGAWQAYQGGKLKGEGNGLAAGHHIRPGGMLVLGQEQDSLGGGFDSTQAMVGELSQVGLWDRVLSSTQVVSLARCGRVTQGIVVPWTENGIGAYGGATKDPGEPCSKHKSPQ